MEVEYKNVAQDVLDHEFDGEDEIELAGFYQKYHEAEGSGFITA